MVGFAEPIQRLPDSLAEGSVLADGARRLVYIERNGRPRASEVLRALYAAGLPVAEVETRASRLEDVLLDVLHGRTGAAP
jgi:ABC-2 type transport system ATP-binding protein